MATTVIKLKDAIPYFSVDGPFGKEMRRAGMKGIYSTILRAKRDIVSREIPAEPRPPVDRGMYKAAWGIERLPNGAAIFNNAPHAVFIEYGVPNTNVVPSKRAVMNISEWAQRKFGASAKEAISIAEAVLHSLKRRGIFARGKGLRILEKYVQRKMPDILKKEVEAEIAKAFP